MCSASRPPGHVCAQDELAAILRFGAEELFKEDEAAAASRGRELEEEELDAILARAEVGWRH